MSNGNPGKRHCPKCESGSITYCDTYFCCHSCFTFKSLKGSFSNKVFFYLTGIPIKSDSITFTPYPADYNPIFRKMFYDPKPLIQNNADILEILIDLNSYAISISDFSEFLKAFPLLTNKQVNDRILDLKKAGPKNSPEPKAPPPPKTEAPPAKVPPAEEPPMNPEPDYVTVSDPTHHTAKNISWDTYAELEKLGGTILNKSAAEGQLFEAIGRDNEIEDLLLCLCSNTKRNVILLGNPGVGKTKIVEGLAYKLVFENQRIPPKLKDTVLVSFPTGMMDNSPFKGKLEERMEAIIKETKRLKNVFVFFDEIHMMISTSSIKGISDIIKQSISEGEIRIIGATTNMEYNKYFNDDAFKRRFQSVEIPELSKAATISVLKKFLLNNKISIKFTEEHLKSIVDFCELFIKKRFFPDKAIDVLDRIVQIKTYRDEKFITLADIKAVISKITGVPFIEEDEIQNLKMLNSKLKAKVIGQDEAIESICNKLKITRRRFDSNPYRPDGVFLFTGPTGTGKTYLAKCLAEILFGSPNRLFRLDMSEFANEADNWKLLGSSSGYIGSDEVPPITLFMQENHSGIILLDEIEKSHERVIKIFLQAFDEGHLTDAKGRKLDFSDSIFILTSNIVIQTQRRMGFMSEIEMQAGDLTQMINRANPSKFPMELLNRIDEIILFNPLTAKGRNEIMLKSIINPSLRNIFKEKGIHFEIDDSAVEHLFTNPLDESLGAREYQRIYDRILLPVITEYLDKKPNKKVSVSFKNGWLFTPVV